MSKVKFLSLFLPQMETTVFIILQTFFANFENRGIVIFPSFGWGIFSHVTRPIAHEQKCFIDYNAQQAKAFRTPVSVG